MVNVQVSEVSEASLKVARDRPDYTPWMLLKGYMGSWAPHPFPRVAFLKLTYRSRRSQAREGDELEGGGPG